MSDRFFVDTNILIYAHQPSTGLKHQRAQTLIENLWQSRQGVLSTQVLQELCVNLQRKLEPPLPAEQLRQLLRDYMRWNVIVNTAESVIEALELELRHKISFWDALVLHSAQSAGASVLYSEDFAAGQKYDGVEVVNPLVAP